MKNCFRLGALAALAIVYGSALADTHVAGIAGANGLRVAVFDGANYVSVGTPVAKVNAGNLIAIGHFKTGSEYDVVVNAGGNFVLWSFDAANVRTSSQRLASIPAGYARSVGTGSFDEDADLGFVWQDASGNCFCYEIDAATGTFSHIFALGNPTSAGFTNAVGIADCDDDGDDDIVLQDPATREVRYRYYNTGEEADMRGLSTALTNDSDETIIPGGTVMGASNEGGGLQLHIKSMTTGATRIWNMSGVTRDTNFGTNGWNANWSMTVGN